MSHEPGFLRAIIQNPDDDTPRLIYADWLEERGDPRGEFIRVQCELARSDQPSARHQQLLDREKQLLARHRREWDAPLQRLCTNCVYRRGFLETVRLQTTNFLRHAEELFLSAPIVGLRLSRPGPSVSLIVRIPWLARVRLLDLGRNRPQGYGESMRDTGVRLLAECPYLRNVTELLLEYHDIHNGGAIALAESPNLQELTVLRLTHNRIAPAGVRALVESPWLVRLTTLALSGNQLGNAGAQILAKAPRLQEVQAMGTGIGEEGLQALRARFGGRVKV
jgi:uncharacterized protein (TIGR02996 family)